MSNRLNGFINNKNISVILNISFPLPRMRQKSPTILTRNMMHRTLLEDIITTIYKTFPKAEIIVVTGINTSLLIPYRTKFRIVENQLFDSTRDGESIRLALNNIHHEDILIINGNIFFNKPTIDSIGKTSSLIYESNGQLPSTEVGMTVVNNEITMLEFGLDKKFTDICFLSRENTDKLYEIVCNPKNSKLFLFELINKMIDNGSVFEAINPGGMKILKLHSIEAIVKYQKML